MWLEETGWSTAGTNAVSEQQQAKNLQDFLEEVSSGQSFDRFFIYEIIDDPDCDDKFGILNSDYTGKPAYIVLKDFIESRDLNYK